MTPEGDSTVFSPRPRQRSFTGSLRGSLILTTAAGCLAMVYSTAVTSPATTEFFRKLGANELHFGLLAGIPLMMLFMQFPGVLLTNRLRTRKPVFIVAVIFSRLLYLPVAFLPLLIAPDHHRSLLPVFIILLTLGGAVHNVVVPLWYSWIGDLVPRRRLNSYWGKRLLAMQVTWVLSFLAIWAFTYFTELPITWAFPSIVVVGVVAGVIDIVLFLGVKEPENQRMENVHPWQVMTQPLRDPQYRRFVLFSCAWAGSTMFCAAFMQLYVLQVLQLEVWRTILIWCMSGVGGALTAHMWGRLADRHGNRPVLVICTSLKSMIVIVFLLITRDSSTIALSIAFLFDSMLNAGNQIASNGYMLKLAPRENRSAFIAAITGLAGICGGLAALAAGAYLRCFSSFAVEFWGRTWINYHLLFFTGLFLRWGCILLVRRVHEPQSTRSIRLLNEMRGIWPLRFILFPIGLYRHLEDNGDDPENH